MPHASTAVPVPDSKLRPSNKVPNACTKDIHAMHGNGWTVGKRHKEPQRHQRAEHRLQHSGAGNGVRAANVNPGPLVPGARVRNSSTDTGPQAKGDPCRQRAVVLGNHLHGPPDAQIHMLSVKSVIGTPSAGGKSWPRASSSSISRLPRPADFGAPAHRRDDRITGGL